MYKIMFYGGIVGVIISVMYAVFMLKRKNIVRCIKDLMGMFGLGIICCVMGTFIIAINLCANDSAGYERTIDEEKTRRMSSLQSYESDQSAYNNQDFANDDTADDKVSEGGASLVIDDIRYINVCADADGDVYGDEIKSLNEIVYCRNEVEMEFRIIDDKAQLSKLEDGREKVYVKIKDGELLHYADPIDDKKNYYSVRLFSEEWTEIEEDYFDGILELYAEDEIGNTCIAETDRFIMYKGLPEVVVKAVDESDAKHIFIADEAMETSWTSEDVELSINVEDKIGIEELAYSIGNGEEVIINYVGEIKKEDAVSFTVTDSAVSKDGVAVKIRVKNYCGSIATENISVLIDKNAPQIKDIRYDNSNRTINENNGVIYSSQTVRLSFYLNDNGSGINDSSVHAIFENGKTVTAGKNKNGAYYIDISGDDLKGSSGSASGDAFEYFFDGAVTLWASDMSGNYVSLASKRIICYSGKPELKIDTDGTIGKWTGKNVKFRVKASDGAVGIKRVECIVDGEKVKDFDIKGESREQILEYVVNKSAKDRHGCKVEFSVVNMCGSETKKSFKVYLDKEAPKLSLSGVSEGAHYSGNVSVSALVSDVSYPAAKVKCYVSRVSDGITYTEKERTFIPKDFEYRTEMTLEHEGEYRIYARAVDGAGNVAETKPITFVIDKTAPELSIGGVRNNSMNGKEVVLRLGCYEAFCATNDITVSVSYSYGSSSREYELKPFTKEKIDETVTETFVEDGVYYVSISAVDRAGNAAKEKHIRFFIDRTAPKVEVTGTDAYEQWDKPVELSIAVTEYNYKTSRVVLSGKRTDIDGEKHELTLPRFVSSGDVSTMRAVFEEDGIYDIRISARDSAGNVVNKGIHFLVDTRAPEIIGLDKFDNLYLKEFSLGGIIDKMFRDLTLKSFRILLNGIEYEDFNTINEEGKYNLYVEAADELGHVSSKRVEFVVDNTAPKAMFFGINDGDTVFEQGIITWKLNEESGEITKICVNGEEISADVTELRYNEYGGYCIEIESIDLAGNEGYSKMQFEYAESGKKGDRGGIYNAKETVEGYWGGDKSSTETGGYSSRQRYILIGLLIGTLVFGGAAFIYAFKIRERN